MNYMQGYYQSPVGQQYGYQPMYQNQMVQPQIQGVQKNEQLIRLQGKSVESMDVVKAMDIPLDGSISYFPLADGTAIVTKQLQMDGTSKIIVYKPIENTEEEKDKPKYITEDELKNALNGIDINSLKEESKIIKKQLKDITREIEDLKEVK